MKLSFEVRTQIPHVISSGAMHALKCDAAQVASQHPTFPSWNPMPPSGFPMSAPSRTPLYIRKRTVRLGDMTLTSGETAELWTLKGLGYIPEHGP